MSDEARQSAIEALSGKIAAKNADPEPAVETPAPVAAAPETAPEPEKAEAEKPAEPTGETDAERVARKQKKRTKQDRIDRLTRQRTERDREIGYLRAQVEQLQRQQPPQARAPEKPTTAPQLADYAFDPVKHQEALTDWIVEQKLAQRDRQQSQNRQTQAQQEAQQAFQKRLAAFESKHPGAWEDITHAPIDITDTMAGYVAASEGGLDVALYLSQHADEASKIAAMPPIQAIRELGNIETRLAQPVQKPAKPSPPPPPPTIQPGGSSETPIASWGIDDHIKAVREQRKAKFS